MCPFQMLSVLAMRQLANAAAHAPIPGGRIAGGVVGAAAAFLAVRFTDSSQRVPDALRRSTDQAWRALEIALAGESLLSRLDRAEDKTFRQQVRTFLNAVPSNAFRDPQWRKSCLAEVRAIRQAGAHLAGTLDGADLAERSAAFLRYTDPAEALASEWRYLDNLAEELHRLGYPHLAELVNQRVGNEAPLLVVAVRFFFRLEVESDSRLFRGLTCQQIDHLSNDVRTGFIQLDDALRKQGERLESLLLGIDVKLDSIDDKLEALRRQMEQLLAQAGVRLGQRGARPMRTAQQRRKVQKVLADVGSLPVKQRQSDMLLASGQLRYAAGDLAGARQDLREAANLGGAPQVQAEVETMLRQLDEMPMSPEPVAEAAPTALTSSWLRRGLSAVLGIVFVSTVLGGVWLVTRAPEFRPGTLERNALPLLGISVLIGGAGAWVLCSVRSWIFVVLCTLTGLVGGLTADALGWPLTSAGTLANLMYGAGLGVLLAFAAGVPIKGLADLARGANQPRPTGATASLPAPGNADW
jgi:hypothetical protein